MKNDEKIDLITGFLGSGKTTFYEKKYATYLLQQGMNIGILENDFGAVNVDAMLLQDILGDHCTLEMVAGGCDADCHRRRFKTKLIAMGMCGYDRVLVEPSGIFDMDEFLRCITRIPPSTAGMKSECNYHRRCRSGTDIIRIFPLSSRFTGSTGWCPFIQSCSGSKLGETYLYQKAM